MGFNKNHWCKLNCMGTNSHGSTYMCISFIFSLNHNYCILAVVSETEVVFCLWFWLQSSQVKTKDMVFSSYILLIDIIKCICSFNSGTKWTNLICFKIGINLSMLTTSIITIDALEVSSTSGLVFIFTLWTLKL